MKLQSMMITWGVLLLLPCFGHSTTTQSCPTPPHPHTLHRPGTCYSIHLQDNFYVDAAKTCSSHGGSLATITTHSENQFITDKLKAITTNNTNNNTSKYNSDKFWIGLNTFVGKTVERKGQEVKVLTWEDGSPMTFGNLQESNGTLEKMSPYLDHCVAVDPESGTWHELACTQFGTLTWDRKNPFICEFAEKEVEEEQEEVKTSQHPSYSPGPRTSVIDGDFGQTTTVFDPTAHTATFTTKPTTVNALDTNSDDTGGSSRICPPTFCDVNGCDELDFKTDSKGCFTCECNVATTTVAPIRVTTGKMTCPTIVCNPVCGMAFVFKRDSKGCVTCECDTATQSKSPTTATTPTPKANIPTTTTTTTTEPTTPKSTTTTSPTTETTTTRTPATIAPPTTSTTTQPPTTTPLPPPPTTPPSPTTTTIPPTTPSITTTSTTCPSTACPGGCNKFAFKFDANGCVTCECDPSALTTTTTVSTTGESKLCPALACHTDCGQRGYLWTEYKGCVVCECKMSSTTASTSSEIASSSAVPASCPDIQLCSVNCLTGSYKRDPVTGCTLCKCDFHVKATTIITTSTPRYTTCPSLSGCPSDCGQAGHVLDTVTGCTLCDCLAPKTTTRVTTPLPTCAPMKDCFYDCIMNLYVTWTDPVTGCQICFCTQH